MKIALTAQILVLALRREEKTLIAEVKLAGQCVPSVLCILGVTSIQNGFWLLDTGGLLYSGITEVKLSQRFTNVAVRFAEQPLWHGVALGKLAFTPFEQHRVALRLALLGRIEHGLLRLLAERLKEEIAVCIERADLLEESEKPKRVVRLRTHAERPSIPQDQPLQ